MDLTITDQNSSPPPLLPEVAGDAALLVDSFNEQAIAQAIHQVVTDENLAPSLTEKGTRQENQFSLRRIAQETAKVYRQTTGQQCVQE